jgi:hypothetical protein
MGVSPRSKRVLSEQYIHPFVRGSGCSRLRCAAVFFGDLTNRSSAKKEPSLVHPSRRVDGGWGHYWETSPFVRGTLKDRRE